MNSGNIVAEEIGIRNWIITIGDGYGSFAYRGTEEDARDRTVRKMAHEGSWGRFRLATDAAEDQKMVLQITTAI